MARYILKRIISTIPVFICVSILLFAIAKMMPGDQVLAMIPTSLRGDAFDQAYATMYQKLGLDKSMPEQYLRWMVNMFQGEYGYSSYYNRPVADIIGEPMKNTIYLNLIVVVLQIAIVLPVGIRAATKRLSLFDNAWSVFTLITYSMPSFFVGLCLLYVFSIRLGWLPFGGLPNSELYSGTAYLVQYFRHVCLPVITLTVINIAGTYRYVRNAMIDALGQDYIRTARSKGLSERVVVYSHAFRNALIPVSTVIITQIFSMFVGSPITEQVFAFNGIGHVLMRGLSGRDAMLIITINWIFSICYVLGNLVADVVYGLVDPRIKLS